MSISNRIVDILKNIKNAVENDSDTEKPVTVTEKITETAPVLKPAKSIETVNTKLLINSKNVSTFIRKFAHFAEFMFLGIILYIIKIYTNKFKITEVLLICQSVAVIDEYIQSFSDRSDKVTDIIIDISGAMTGVLITFIIQKIIKNRKKGDKKCQEK